MTLVIGRGSALLHAAVKRAHHDFAAWLLGEHAPANVAHLSQEGAPLAFGRRMAAHDELAGFEDRPDDRRLLKVHVARRFEDDRRRRVHLDMMTFGDFIERHEAIEQRIPIVTVAAWADAAVAIPRRRRVCRVRASGHTDPRKQPSDRTWRRHGRVFTNAATKSRPSTKSGHATAAWAD
jgi:hypothetical protein